MKTKKYGQERNISGLLNGGREEEGAGEAEGEGEGEGEGERERVVWRALVAPHSLHQILWCVVSCLSDADTSSCRRGRRWLRRRVTTFENGPLPDA